MSVILFLNGLSIYPAAQENPKKKEYPSAKHYEITPTISKIKVDGVPEEDAWQDAVKIDLPFEWLPGDNIPAPVKTGSMWGRRM